MAKQTSKTYIVMTRLLTKVVRDSDKTSLTYFSGKLNCILTLDETIDVSEEYSITLYNDYLWMLLHSEAGDKHIKQKERDFSVSFSHSIVWMPGHYFLLFQMGEVVLRFELQMQENGNLLESGCKLCPKYGMEYILAKRISGKPYWNYFNSTPGLIQWKNWLIKRLQQRELNTLRAEHSLGMLPFCNNMLIASDTSDFVWRSLLLLTRLADIKNVEERIDCSDLYGPREDYPYNKIDDIFATERYSDKIIGLELPDLKDCQYSFHNIGMLLRPGMEGVLDKILSHAPTYYNSVILCGTQKDIDLLRDRYPELRSKFPDSNCFSSEPAAIEELILTFFREAENAKIQLSPESVDRVCRLLSRKYLDGEIRNWTISDVRRYITAQVIPSYTQRAIEAMQQGEPLEEVVNILPEDLAF